MEDQALEQSAEEKMMAYLEAEEKLENEPPEDEEAPAEQEEEEVTDEESEEDTPEPRTFKLKRGDEEIEAPESEVIELAQKGYDYTKKTQALAEERKAVEEYAQTIKVQEQYIQQQFSTQQALIKEVAKVEALNDQIEQYERLDWQAMTDNDPVQAQKLFFTYTQLTNQRQKAIAEYNAKRGEVEAAQNQRTKQAAADGYKQLVKDIPDWSAEKQGKVTEAGKQYGFSDQELANVYDPRMVRVLHDAMLYRQLQQAKPTVDKKVANKPPVVKPGGKDAKSAARTQSADIKAKLRQTGRDEYAAKLIEQML